MSRARYFVIEGPIGVGKTTLTRMLCERFSARGMFEIVEENPFLADFYKNRDQLAFQTQLFFLLSRYKQQLALTQHDLFQQVTVSDYLFAKDRIFASLTLDKNELALYERIYAELGPRVVKPDLVIYLQARLDVLLTRIQKRGREFERQFDAAYLEALCKAYNDFFHHYSETPLLILNNSDLNVLEDPSAVDAIVAAMEATREGTRHYLPQEKRLE